MALPQHAPIMVPALYCSSCGQKMRIHIERFGIKQITAIHAYCDTDACKYHVVLSHQYIQTTEQDNKWLSPEDWQKKYDAAFRQFTAAKVTQEANKKKADEERAAAAALAAAAAPPPDSTVTEQPAGDGTAAITIDVG